MIDPLAVLATIKATLREFGDTGFDATTFVTAYGRARGRAVMVEETGSLAWRGMRAETWICETYDIIRIDRQVPAHDRNMLILMQWAHIHYSEQTGAVAPFDILADAVISHRAVPAVEVAPAAK